MRWFRVVALAIVLTIPPVPAGAARHTQLDMWAECEATPECVAWFDALALNVWLEALVHVHPFLVCTRSHESSPNPPLYDDGYQAYNPAGPWLGAYQFVQSTWDAQAERMGRFDLVGVDPRAASVADNDRVALALYEAAGAGPWVGRCAGL